MKTIITLTLILLGANIYAQQCNCTTQFAFVKAYYEKNNPAFQKIKADNHLLQQYNKAVNIIQQEVSKETNTDICNIYFDKYLSLLKDHHSNIGISLGRRQGIDFSKQEGIDSFKSSAAFKAFSIINVDTTQIFEQLKTRPTGDIEGIYISDNNIKIAVVANTNTQYQGIVVRKNKLLDVGHILFTLTKKEDGSFDCLYNTGLLGLNFNTAFMNNVRLEDGDLPHIGFARIGNKPQTSLWEFKELDTNTNYLSVKSFDYSLKPQLDSLYQQIIPKMQEKKYLVLDIRNNGGGSEENYFELLPLIYTQPMKIDEVQVWVSPDNIKAYEQLENKDEELISRMKKARPFSFIGLKENAQKELTMTGTRFPEKIAILYNRGTASAGEGLIAYAIQSSKVLTLGEHSGGYIGYGNVMTHETPCNKFIIHSTTTKYNNLSKYEFAGIPPMVPLNGKPDWIKEAVLLLKK